jgi:uroporphyrinogen decarboxylase
MPFGTPDEVQRVCRRMIEEVGKGGGLLLAPTHTLEPEVSWDNIHAFIEVVNEFNNI